MAVQQQMQDCFAGPGFGDPQSALLPPGVFRQPAQTQHGCGIRKQERQFRWCRPGHNGSEKGRGGTPRSVEGKDDAGESVLVDGNGPQPPLG